MHGLIGKLILNVLFCIYNCFATKNTRIFWVVIDRIGDLWLLGFGLEMFLLQNCFVVVDVVFVCVDVVLLLLLSLIFILLFW